MSARRPTFQVILILIRPSKVDDVKLKVYQKWFTNLEAQCTKEKLKLDFDYEDLYFAARELCETRCAATGERITGMNLAIWDKTKPVNGKNLLLFSGKYFKVASETPEGMIAYPFSDEERKRIDELLERAQKEYNPKAAYYTASDNYS